MSLYHGVGCYDVQLNVSNSGGSDTWHRECLIEVMDTGECDFEPLQNITIQPTIAPLPTGIPTNYINASAWRLAACNSTALGNSTEVYCVFVDNISNVTYQTFSSVLLIMTTPLNWINGSVSGVSTGIETIIEPLVESASIFLELIGRALAALPAVIINIVTLALLIDIVRILLKGQGGE
jgi:PKD repeat protein